MVTVGIEAVKDRWLVGEIPVTDAQLTTLVADAVTELLLEIPDLDARLASGAITQNAIDAVVAKAVIRALRNPDGLESESEGDYSYKRPGDGFVWFRDVDLDRLRGRRRRASWHWVA